MKIFNMDKIKEDLCLLYKSHSDKFRYKASHIDICTLSSNLFNNYNINNSTDLRYKSVYFNDRLAIYDDVSISQQYSHCIAILIVEKDGTSFYFIAKTKEERKHLNIILDAHFKPFFDSISKKHPKIAKAIKLKYKSVDLIKAFNVYSYYNDLLSIKKHIKGKKVSELSSIITDDLLRSVFHLDVCNKKLNYKKILVGDIDNHDDFSYHKITNHDLHNSNDSKEYCNIINFIENIDYERVNDFATHLGVEFGITSLIKSISSSKDRNLFNDDSRLILQNIISIYKKENITNISSHFHNNFSNKIAKYKTTVELNRSLQSYSNILSNWDIDLWIQKYKHLPITYQRAESDSNILIIKVSDFKTMSIIGSPQWCIATDQSHFFEYAVRGYAHQYILLDFNKAIYDFDSMVGITLDQFSQITHMHDKNDSCLMYLDSFFFIEDLMREILSALKYRASVI